MATTLPRASAPLRLRPFTAADKSAWLDSGVDRGFLRVFDPTATDRSVVVPLSTVTSCRQVALKLGCQPDDLHVQIGGDILRRLEAFERPLAVLMAQLEAIGVTNPRRRLEMADLPDVAYILRFYAGRPNDTGWNEGPLRCCCLIRFGPILPLWRRRLCVLDGSRLLIYPDLDRHKNPQVVPLRRARVTEVDVRGRGKAIRISAAFHNFDVAFDSPADFHVWLSRSQLAAGGTPPMTDLSHRYLESLPTEIFQLGSDQLLTQLNLRRNRLRERRAEEKTIGWLDDLPQLQSLRQLNLAENDIGPSIPPSLLQLLSLTELNLTGNRLEELPEEICGLRNLKTLSLQNNRLHRLPRSLTQLPCLTGLDLSFNRFTQVPTVLSQLRGVDVWLLSGNLITKLPSSEILKTCDHVRKVELRHNSIVIGQNSSLTVGCLATLTYLDIRDCGTLGDLQIFDLKSLSSLQVLHCERNAIATLQLNGTSLISLHAAHNNLSSLVIMPVPHHMKILDLSHNRLSKLPEWLTEITQIERIFASHNTLTCLPHRIFTNVASLKHLDVNHNSLRALPHQVENCLLETLLLHANKLSRLPPELLASTPKLRVLNVAQNYLSSLPSPNPFADLNRLQTLFASGNRLQDDVLMVVSGFRRLKVLDLAYNNIRNVDNSSVEKLSSLEEVNLSGNRLICLPSAFAQLERLAVLRIHSNRLDDLPNLAGCASLKVLDLAANHLESLDLTHFVSPELKHLDLSCNPRLKLDSTAFEEFQPDRLVSLIDMSQEVEAVQQLSSTEVPWQAGFSETSGERNKLCLSQIRHPLFDADAKDSLFGLIEGGLNPEIPALLQTELPRLVRAELQRPDYDSSAYLKYATLEAHRSLGQIGQKLGATFCLCHIRKSADVASGYQLHLANVGSSQVVLCRKGQPLVVSRKFLVGSDAAEYQRVREAGGIITEENDINGVTGCSRLLGCSFLHPQVIPDPHVDRVDLCEADEFLLMASRGLWDVMEPAEAVRRVRLLPNPILAAKHLQDVAQSYGCRGNLSVLLVRFFLGSGDPSTPPPFPIPTGRHVIRLGQAASAVDLLGDSSESEGNSDADEVQSEPQGRKLRPAPNFYFDYKRRLKELQADSAESDCSQLPSRTASVSTLVASSCDILAAVPFPPVTLVFESQRQKDPQKPSQTGTEEISTPIVDRFAVGRQSGSSSSSGIGKSDWGGSPHNSSFDRGPTSVAAPHDYAEIFKPGRSGSRPERPKSAIISSSTDFDVTLRAVGRKNFNVDQSAPLYKTLPSRRPIAVCKWNQPDDLQQHIYASPDSPPLYDTIRTTWGPQATGWDYSARNIPSPPDCKPPPVPDDLDPTEFQRPKV